MGSAEQEIEWLYAWREGDSGAGDRLLRTYYPAVLRFFRLRAHLRAEDLTQSTFLACTEGRDRVNASSFRAYVFGIAHKLLLKQRRADQRQSSRDVLGDPPPPTLLSPSAVVSLRQEHWLLLRALERLTHDQQVIIAFHYVDGLRVREIGDALDMPVSTVTTRLSRARAALREQVQQLRANANVRTTVMADLDGWVRSLATVGDALPV